MCRPGLALTQTEHERDQHTIAWIRRGETRRYAELVDRHKERAMTLAVRMLGDRHDAEETVQDAFVRAYKSLDSFRGDAKFSTWLYTIVRNLCLTRISRRKETHPSYDDPEIHHGGEVLADRGEFSILERLGNEEIHTSLSKMIDELPEKYRTVITLFYLQEMQCEEVCSVLNIPEGTVKTLLFRGRSLLRERLSRSAYDDVRAT